MAVSASHSEVPARFVSFVGGLRYPAPDVARGFMLLLIAIANVVSWTATFPEKIEKTVPDQWIVLLRTMLIEGRAYPLFAMLFGFGLMIMINRIRDAHIARREAQEAVGGALPAEPSSDAGRMSAHEEGVRKGIRLIMTRGWWMLLFGAAHAVFFSGDIIGSYAIVAIVLAIFLARKKWGILYVISAVVAVITISLSLGNAAVTTTLSAEYKEQLLQAEELFNPIQNITHWGENALLMTLVTSFVIPSVVIGARLADTDIITHPERYSRLLWSAAIGGLTVASLLATPHALVQAEFVTTTFIGSAELQMIGGLFGGIGWLALLTLLAGPARESLTGWRWVMSAIGRRSLTAYLSQTLLFLSFCAALQFLGVRSLNEYHALTIAVVVWIFTVVMCVAMEKAGWKRGPCEHLLRHLVARTNRPTD